LAKQSRGQRHSLSDRWRNIAIALIIRDQATDAQLKCVANETFKDLFAPNPVPLKFEDEDWPLAWVAVSHEKIVGVIITNQEWVSGYVT
jgi:hypothetical protein